MKAFFWKKVTMDRVRNSVWNDISSSNEVGSTLDLEKLTELFTVQDPKKKKAVPKPKAKAEGPRSCLSGQRSQNIGIVLSFLKLNAETLNQAVLQMDSKVLSNEALEALATILPTDDEMKAVQKAKEGRDLVAEPLPPSDAYVDAMAGIPRLQQRITCWQFSNDFDVSLRDVRQQQDTLSRVERALIDSKRLQDILAIILTLGNILNSGNFHGGAQGFTIENLANLESVKAQDGATTLLDYLVMTVDEKKPELLGVQEDLAELLQPHMKNISMKVVQERVAALDQGLARLRSEIDHFKGRKNLKPEDRFEAVMEAFFATAHPKMEDLRRRQERLETLQMQMCDWFSEEKNGFDETVFMGYITTFLRRFDAVHKSLQAKKARQAKKAGGTPSRSSLGGRGSGDSPTPTDPASTRTTPCASPSASPPPAGEGAWTGL
eukprot:EG_transcript_10867